MKADGAVPSPMQGRQLGREKLGRYAVAFQRNRTLGANPMVHQDRHSTGGFGCVPLWQVVRPPSRRFSGQRHPPHLKGLYDFGLSRLLAASKALVKKDAVKRRAQFMAQGNSGQGTNGVCDGFRTKSVAPGKTGALWIIDQQARVGR